MALVSSQVKQAKPLVLVVDDEEEIRNSLLEILSEKYDVICASNALDAFRFAGQTLPSVILLDIYMPGHDGITFLDRLRANPATKTTPVIMMTAMDGKDTRIRAFNSGADDFIAKPFDVDELFSRVHAKLRWVEDRKGSEQNFLSFDNLSLDLFNARATMAGRDLNLGFIEFKILWALALQRSKLVTRTSLEEMVWGDNVPVTRSLDSHIACLRRKLTGGTVAVRTVYGEGYVLE
jgi:two-component system alkaline phosphatase synthesis response regulator PhoP